MSEWNQWENRIGSWKPRRPSAKVKERLAGLTSGSAGARGQSIESAESRGPSGWHAPARWLAPAMACLLLAAAGLSARHSPIPYWSAPSTNMLWEGSLFQQPGYAAYFAGAGHTFQNHSPEGFEIRGGLHLDGISILNTNNLIR